MSRYYEANDLKSQLEIEQVFDLLEAWQGEPEYIDGGIIAQTICHNLPGEGSRKLYFYSNTSLFHCYTSCSGESTFDIFELCIRVMKRQHNLDWDLYDAMNYIASYFGLAGQEREDGYEELDDWEIFKRHKRQTYEIKEMRLKEYDASILSRFAYPRIYSWEQEGISHEVCLENHIGYYPGAEQITIPHYDIEGRLVGIRGRYLADDQAKRYGKYRPLIVNRQMYSHPLSMNLYNLNNSQETIRQVHVAIVFESEKACLAYRSYYGPKNDISIACCGSSLSTYQMRLLKSLGVSEVIIAFDRDFVEIGDDTFRRLKAKLIHLYNKYNNSIKISAIFDKRMILPIHASPIDAGPRTFEKLLNERIIPYGDD